MRITIDIDDKMISKIQESTGLRKKSPAIHEALKIYIRDRRKNEMIQKILNGQSDYGMTNDELEGMSNYDSN